MIIIEPDRESEDWIKQSWDVRTGGGDLVTNLQQLREVLGWSDERLTHLLDLPVGQAIPPSLRADLIRLRQQH